MEGAQELMASYSASPEHRLVLLAPRQFKQRPGFGTLSADRARHDHLLGEMQRFRGAIYLSDGAIRSSDLTADGRHCQVADNESWHVLSLDRHNFVKGCSRYRSYDESVRFEHFGVSRSEIARSELWANRLFRAVQNELAVAQERGISMVEVGGWAVAKEARFGTDALRLALSTFSLARMLGGCIALTTATVRHCSAAILRKLGGRSLEVDGQAIPRYFDTAYDCDMEILRFDSAEPNPRYAETLDRLTADLAAGEVVSAGRPAEMTLPWIATPERMIVHHPILTG
jgi:hypothetical protein